MSTIQQASKFKRTSNDKEFIFWLTFFHNIMPHVDILISAHLGLFLAEDINFELNTWRSTGQPKITI